jgi:hypothetical protein
MSDAIKVALYARVKFWDSGPSLTKPGFRKVQTDKH